MALEGRWSLKAKCARKCMLSWYFECAKPTFKVEENIGSVVFEHLSHQLDIHVLNIDILRLARVNPEASIFLLRTTDLKVSIE